MHDNTAEELHKCVYTIFKIRLYVTLALFENILLYESLTVYRQTHAHTRAHIRNAGKKSSRPVLCIVQCLR